VSVLTPVANPPFPPTADPAPTPSGPDDAVVAATRYLTEFTPQALLDPARRERFLERWAEPAARDSLAHQYALEAQNVRRIYGGVPTVGRYGLVGYRTSADSAGNTRVSIWAAVLTAGSHGSAMSGWGTITVALHRHLASWKVTAVKTVVGPGPGDAGERLAGQAGSFRPFSYAR
jgi:hypothetical protein